MHNYAHSQLRRDLIIRPTHGSGGSTVYVIQDPVSRQSFEFDEREYFLCRAFDGTTTLPEIATQFQKKFQLSVSENSLECFARELAGYGLFQEDEQTEAVEVGDKLVRNSEAEDSENSRFTYGVALWSASSPERLLIAIGVMLRPFRFAVWLIVPLLVFALGILIQEGALFRQDITEDLQFVPKLLLALPTEFIYSFTSRGLQGIVAAYSGAKIRYLKLFLLLWIIPRLIVDREYIWGLNRRGKLWSFATPILVRLSIISVAIFLWHSNRTFATNLASWAQTLILIGCVGLFLETNPFWFTGISNGFGWLLTYCSIDRSILKQSQQLWGLILYRKPLPPLLKTRNILFLLSYGAMVVLVSLGFLLGILTLAAIRLEYRLQGTGVVIFCILIAALTQKIMSKINSKPNSKHDANSASVAIETNNSISSSSESQGSGMSQKVYKFFTYHSRSLLFILGGIVVLLLPYSYSVGGQIKLMPLQSQDIQTDLGGKVIKVPLKGGNNQLIKVGTVIGVLESFELGNELLTAKEQVKAQKAVVEQQQAKLNQLLATPRPEEVVVAQAELGKAQEELQLAKSSQHIAEVALEVENKSLSKAQEGIQAAQFAVETEIINSRYRDQEEKRLKQLSDEGAIPLQDYEDAQRLAEISRNRISELQKNVDVAQQTWEEQLQTVEVKKKEIEERKQNVRSAQQTVEKLQADLNLVLSGSHPDQVDAARQEVERAKADLQRFQYQVSYLSKETNRQQLKMPFDGTLVTANLDKKIGQYLAKGDTFATAENSKKLMGVVEIPEVQIDEISKTGSVEIRLLGYPNHKFKGRILSIEPTAKTDDMFGQTSIDDRSGNMTQYIPGRAGQVVSILIDIEDDKKLLVPGMSGYAKIRGNSMPVILAFSRPLVRFFQIEVWSWFP
jgi:multidrug resistance efflux pump